MVSTVNKPNGYIYRLREEVHRHLFPALTETEGLELYISEQIDLGWLTFYRLPAGDEKYDFVVVIWDNNNKPLYIVNL